VENENRLNHNNWANGVFKAHKVAAIGLGILNLVAPRLIFVTPENVRRLQLIAIFEAAVLLIAWKNSERGKVQTMQFK
jgi:hypothetical protein